ncbi:tetratricopeptide repeat protein [uncultured Microscilla sp.]|uniref:tetratricopeptide repeat protein n=1 Tax=uncultured Microscilla sp. TaxID=432653 RepID=UPI00261A8038|nr:tetratricopeptide repeat protein [uncultured Microscilla sp.]
MKISGFCLLLFLLVAGQAWGQNQRLIDSLLQVLPSDISDRQKVDIYNMVAREYRYSDSVKVALYTTKAKQLARKINYPEGVTNAQYYLAWVIMRKGHYAKALELQQQALATAQKSNYAEGEANAYNGLGAAYWRQGNYAKTLEAYQSSLKIREKIGDKRGMAGSYNNISLVYRMEGKYTQSLEFAQKSLDISKSINNQTAVAYIYNNMGITYKLQGNYAKAQECYQLALAIRIKMKDQSGIAESYFDLGKFALTRKQYDNAQKYLNQALVIQKKIGAQSALADTRVILGKAFYDQNKYSQAQQYLNDGVQLARNLGNPRIERDGVEYLAKVFKAQGKYAEAYQNLELYTQLADSLFNEEKIRKLTQLASRYVAEKREDSLRARQAQMAADLKNRKLEQRSTYIGLGLTIALILVLLFFYVEKQRNNRKLNQTNHHLTHSNQELQTANETIKVAHEEIKAMNDSLETTLHTVEKQHEDITASITYAQRIQQAMLHIEEDTQESIPDHFILFRPRDIVSGDFYWVEQTRGKVFMVVADCTGHGVPGAFMTMIGSLALTDIIVQQQFDNPSDILYRLDAVFRHILKTNNTLVRDGMDVALVVLDTQRQVLQYAGAKTPLLLVQNSNIREVKGAIYSINGYRKKGAKPTFDTHTIDVSIPTTFYLYSDGYQDQFGGKKNRKFMKKRFRELLHRIAEEPLPTQKKLLETALDEWMQAANPPYRQIDDILVMGVRL